MKVFLSALKTYGLLGLILRIRRRLRHRIAGVFDLDHRLSHWKLRFITFTPKKWLPATDSGVEALRKKHSRLLQAENWEFDILTEFPPPWDYDNFSKKTIPLKHFQQIGFAVDDDSGERLGDFMFPNELNKHGWVLGLALAYRVTGHSDYLDALEKNLQDWEKHYRVGWGVPYITTLNVAQRLIHWMLALQLIIDCQKDVSKRIIKTLSRRGYQEFSFLQAHNTNHYLIQNNYAFCESVGCILFLLTFEDTPKQKRLLETWRGVLYRECSRQIDPDGFSLEGSLPYSRFIAEILTVAVAAGEINVLPHLRRMARAISCLVDDSGSLPAFGDLSTEHGFDLGLPLSMLDTLSFLRIASHQLGEDLMPCGVDSVLDLRATLLTNRASFRHSLAAYNKFARQGVKHFKEGGYTVFNDGRCHFVVDHADIGLRGTGGHGHCDIGSYHLSINGNFVIVDPGTHLYSSNRAIRNRYRSSEMHNISQLDGLEMCSFEPSLFQISNAPEVFTEINLDVDPICLSVEHSGFLVDSSRYPMRRRLEVGSAGFNVRDTWDAQLSATSRIHFSPEYTLRLEDGVIVASENGRRVVAVITHEQSDVSIENYLYSPKYGEVKPAQRILVRSPSCKIEYRVEF